MQKLVHDQRAPLTTISFIFASNVTDDNGDIGGLIPSEFGLLSNLRVLALGHNYYLTGSIPTQLGQLSTNLHVLELEETQLSGTIPTELGALKSLGYLDLERTQLGGAIPSELGSLSNLVELEISSFIIRVLKHRIISCLFAFLN